MARQIIKNLKPGAKVALRFAGRGNSWDDEEAVFVGLSEDGERATFRSRRYGDWDDTYEWDAYRFNGTWAYGTSAQRLSLVSVDEEPKAEEIPCVCDRCGNEHTYTR